MKTVLTVVGARPQFVKLAPVLRAFEKASGISVVVVHTGQHFDRDMSQVFFDELELPPPHIHLGIHGGPHGEMTGRMLSGLEALMSSRQPDLVLVVGDTNSTLAGALAAAKLNIAVAHLEAGLRSFNKRMPEEVNRILTDHVSTLLFCPSASAVAQLAREGVIAGVHDVGDVMYDAILAFQVRAEQTSQVRERLGLTTVPYVVATVHRAENTDNPEKLAAIFDYLRSASQHRVVLPLHPRTRERIATFGVSTDGLLCTSPLGYIDMISLVSGAETVFTDSGGLQKEAYFLGRPCVTLREETEWTETVTHGWNRLWSGPEYAPRREITAYGDGHAGDKVVAIVRSFLECA